MEVIKENHSILGLKVLRRWTVRFITAGPRELLAETVSSDFKIFELVCTPEHVRSKQYRDKKGGGGVRCASTCTQAVKSVREGRVIYRSRRPEEGTVEGAN